MSAIETNSVVDKKCARISRDSHRFGNTESEPVPEIPKSPHNGKGFANRSSVQESGIHHYFFMQEALAGLMQGQKRLPCKYFYDERGSRLFEQICELEEYYPTRTELAIMTGAIEDVMDSIGRESLLIEFGSGNSRKTRLLLDHAPDLAGYVPIDIAGEQLERMTEAIGTAYPRLAVWPVCADYTMEFELPRDLPGAARRVGFFPGSTIGNFLPLEAHEFLMQVAKMCGKGGALLIGVDLKKDPAVIQRAYNDESGVTAQFNLNMLRRLNGELGANFRTEWFAHLAIYNPTHGRIEMHLVSTEDQEVTLCGVKIPFALGESIWTESSYKYSVEEFARLAAKAGFRVERVWTDPARLFSVQYLCVV